MFVATEVPLSQQLCRAARPGVSRAIGVLCVLHVRVAGLPSWLARDPENQVATNLSKDPKYQFFAHFLTVHSVLNISSFHPKILGLNIRATHDPGETKPCH